MENSVLSIVMEQDRIRFLLLRKARSVIQDGAMREQLLHLPKPVDTCPVNDVLFRRAGIRVLD